MPNKILFLDIDGPMIPGRAFSLEDKTPPDPILLPFTHIFDPVAVSIINNVCKISGWEIVLHSSWIRLFTGQTTKEHCIKEGLLENYFHKDSWCEEDEPWRYTRVAKWLAAHPDVKEYFIIDDTPYQADLNNYKHPEDMEEHMMLIDFNNGLQMEHWRKLLA